MSGADQTLRFDIVGDAGKAADAFTETASTADLAARGARRLQMALEAERKAVDTNARATLSLASADKILEEVERELSGEAQKDRDAQLEDAAAKKANADASTRSAAQTSKASADLRRALPGGGGLKTLGLLGGLAFGPQALGLAAGVAGVGVAFGAAAAGAGVFGLVAKTELTKVETAQKALATAQASYAKATTAAGRATALKAEQQALAGLSPAEQQLAKDLTTLTKAWDGLGKAEAPVIATAIAPWVQAATGSMSYLRPLVTDTGDAIRILGTEAKTALAAPFWGTFFSTLGHTGEVSLIGFGGALGHLADGLGHLFVTFAPDINKLPGLIDRWSGSFDQWATSYKRSGFDTFINKTFSASNSARLKTDLQDAGTLLGNIAKAVGGVSPLAFSGLSNALTVLAKLTPGQIEAVAVLYSVSKLGSGIGGSSLLSLLGAGGKTGLLGKTIGAGAGAEAAEGAAAAGGVTVGSILLPAAAVAALTGLLVATTKSPQQTIAAHKNLATSPSTTAALQAQITAEGNEKDSAGKAALAEYDLQRALAAGTGAALLARPAAQRLAGDLTALGLSSGTAKDDVARLAGAITQNGASSQQTRSARANLIADLEAVGVKASTAEGVVSALTGALTRVPANVKTVFSFALGSVSPNLNTYLSKTGGGGATVISSGGQAEIRLASGGILSEPVYGFGARSGRSYLLGESGREAVVPLTGARAAAGMLPTGGSGGGGVQVVLSWAGNDGPIGQAIMEGIRAEVQSKGGGSTDSVQRALGQRA